jgi:uncharacterized protein involved in exopolysaccharide biosynthesis
MESAGTAELKPDALSGDERGVDLFDFLLVLSRARRTIAVFTLVAMMLGLLLALVLKPTFTATALILPPEDSHSASSLMGQLGPLASLAGGASVHTPADMYVGILASRTIADNIIEKFQLQKEYKTKKLEDARTVLKTNTRFLATKDGLIHITVEDHDAHRSSDLANAYVDQLHLMNSHLAITEAAQRRVFFDEELADEKNALAAAENDLRRISEKTGVIQLSGQAESIIRSIAEVRAEIASHEVQIQSLRTFATDQNPDIVRAEQEITALREQLAQLERDPRNVQPNATDFVAGSVPEVSLEYARKVREVRYHESLFDLLSKQYEAARIDEAKAAPIIQVVDRAVPPEGKSGPHRILLTLGFAAFGCFAGCVFSLVSDAYGRLKQVPEYALKLAQLRSGFPFNH